MFHTQFIHTPKKGQRTCQPKCSDNINKDEKRLAPFILNQLFYVTGLGSLALVVNQSRRNAILNSKPVECGASNFTSFIKKKNI